MKTTREDRVRFLKKLARHGGAGFPGVTLEDEGGNRIVEEMIRHSLVETAQNGMLRMTAQGRLFLKRALCGHEQPYAAQHRDIAIETRGRNLEVPVNLSESPLARLYRRRGRGGERLVGEAQFLAGERLRRDFETAQLSPKLGPALAPRVDGGRGKNNAADFQENAMEARRKVGRALDFTGREMGSLLLDVCCFLKGLEQVERERRWPARSAKIVLGLALDRLMEHYGLQEAALGPPATRKGGMRVWHAEKD